MGTKKKRRRESKNSLGYLNLKEKGVKSKKGR